MIVLPLFPEYFRSSVSHQELNWVASRTGQKQGTLRVSSLWEGWCLCAGASAGALGDREDRSILVAEGQKIHRNCWNSLSKTRVELLVCCHSLSV